MAFDILRNVTDLQVSEAMCRAFKTAGNLDVNSAIVAQLDQIGAKLL